MPHAVEPRQQIHRKMLIDTFVNAIHLHDDKIVIGFSCKEETKATAFDDVQKALAEAGAVWIWMALGASKP